MTTFLFWNLNKKPLATSVVELASGQNADVLLLAECSIEPSRLKTALNPKGSTDPYEILPSSVESKVLVIHRTRIKFLAYEDRGRFAISRLQPSTGPDLSLVSVHLIDKKNNSDSKKRDECGKLSKVIRDWEHKTGHQRTIVVGDFNLNPFEEAMVSFSYLNAVLSREVIQRRSGQRKYGHETAPFFYNPMWSLFGDRGGRAAGTYLYEPSDPFVYYWNMLDQVLVRPDLLDSFDDEELAILKKEGSDHFPIRFRLQL